MPTAEVRHARFNPGPPSNPRRVNFYGAFRQGAPARAFTRARKIEAAHEAALAENATREEATTNA